MRIGEWWNPNGSQRLGKEYKKNVKQMNSPAGEERDKKAIIFRIENKKN